MTNRERITKAEWDHLRKLVPESKDYPRPVLTRSGRIVEYLVWIGPIGVLATLAGLLYIWWNR